MPFMTQPLLVIHPFPLALLPHVQSVLSYVELLSVAVFSHPSAFCTPSLSLEHFPLIHPPSSLPLFKSQVNYFLHWNFSCFSSRHRRALLFDIVCVCVCVCVCKEICYKVLVYAAMESGKSQDLQGELVSWRCRRAVGLLPISVQKHENQEEPMFQFESKSRKKADVPVPRQSGRRRFSYSGEGRPFCLFMPSTDWMRPNHIRENNLIYSVY